MALSMTETGSAHQAPVLRRPEGSGLARRLHAACVGALSADVRTLTPCAGELGRVPGLPRRPRVPGNLWEPLVKDACEPVDSPGEGGNCPDLGCGDLIGSVCLAGRQRLERLAGFGDGVVGFLFWQPH
jgi:hypothetical protein